MKVKLEAMVSGLTCGEALSDPVALTDSSGIGICVLDKNWAKKPI